MGDIWVVVGVTSSGWILALNVIWLAVRAINRGDWISRREADGMDKRDNVKDAEIADLKAQNRILLNESIAKSNAIYDSVQALMKP